MRRLLPRESLKPRELDPELEAAPDDALEDLEAALRVIRSS